MKSLRLMALVLGLQLAACSGAPAVKTEGDIPGDYYTAVNIWHYKPMRIYSTNYHTGTILRVGTKCRVTGVNKKGIEFETADGKEFRILYVPRHSTITVQEMFGRYFSKKNEMGPGGKFESFTPRERDAVRGAVINPGMRKEAVLMAYGYPPSHRTPSLDEDTWIYFKGLYVPYTVKFENGRTVEGLY